MSATPDTRSVLLPRKGAMPLLRQAVERHGFAVEQQPLACQKPPAWLKRARDRRLALPLCTGLVGSRWLESQKLTVLAEPPTMIEQLWLLLPHGMESTRISRTACGSCDLRSAGPERCRSASCPVLIRVSEASRRLHSKAVRRRLVDTNAMAERE